MDHWQLSIGDGVGVATIHAGDSRHYMVFVQHRSPAPAGSPEWAPAGAGTLAQCEALWRLAFSTGLKGERSSWIARDKYSRAVLLAVPVRDDAPVKGCPWVVLRTWVSGTQRSDHSDMQGCPVTGGLALGKAVRVHFGYEPEGQRPHTIYPPGDRFIKDRKPYPEEPAVERMVDDGCPNTDPG